MTKGIRTVDETYNGLLTGWLDTSGTFYPCDNYEHSETIADLGKNYTRALEAGWIHIGTVAGIFTYNPNKVRQCQLDRLQDIVSHSRCPRCLETEFAYFMQSLND